jgi:hypothetical protein
MMGWDGPFGASMMWGRRADLALGPCRVGDQIPTHLTSSRRTDPADWVSDIAALKESAMNKSLLIAASPAAAEAQRT